MEWVKSINEAISYMEDHITEEISCEEIASHIYLSSFHFQRTFSLLTGMTIGEYIRSRRLSLAGQDLLTTNQRVIDVALKYGYETPESFSRAFVRFHGVTPSSVKKEGTILKSFSRLNIKITLEGGSSMEYRIENKAAFEVVVKLRAFEEATSQEGIPAFWDEYWKMGLGEKVCGMFGICMQAKAGEKTWNYGIGAYKDCVKEIPEGFEVVEMPAYTWAIFTCRGAMPDAMQTLWTRIYNEWLPTADYELIPDTDIEYYTEGDTQSADYISEIWLPVRRK